MIYMDESSVCKAAIHAGALVSDVGGEIMVIIANGEDTYDSAF